MDSLYESNSKGENLPRNRSTKKVRFKDLEPTSDVEMVVESTPTPTLSWKDMVLGKGFTESKGSSDVHSMMGISPFLKVMLRSRSSMVSMLLTFRIEFKNS
ncbi:hypothetical protein Gogos_015471 [Gossypium gossypioides]|uniref:Uncharacterized protein n=1 Tax=Gossypium gossypioides TaxID=34282 RepID=A0A7J9C1Q6_GOSGO|nr:hypothetical protein [Gossypium gossypioides]